MVLSLKPRENKPLHAAQDNKKTGNERASQYGSTTPALRVSEGYIGVLSRGKPRSWDVCRSGNVRLGTVLSLTAGLPLAHESRCDAFPAFPQRPHEKQYLLDTRYVKCPHRPGNSDIRLTVQDAGARTGLRAAP